MKINQVHTRKNLLLKIVMLILTATFVVIALAACSDNNAPYEAFVWEERLHEGRYIFDGQTLTIATYAAEATRLRMFANFYMRYNSGVTIEIIDLGRDIPGAREQMNTRLMAGNIPTMTSGLLADVRNPSVARFFADWLPVMEAHPDFDEANWFMNAFHANAIDGRLYSFPTQISYLYTVANSNVLGLAEAFSGRTGISYAELMELHRQFAQDGMYLSERFDVALAVQNELHRFFDFESGRIEFNNQEFIGFITHARDITSPSRHFGQGLPPVSNDREAEASDAQNYLFMRVSIHFAPVYFSIFDEDTIFVNPIPEVNLNGEVMLWSMVSYALSAAATSTEQALAMDFLMFVMNPDEDRQRAASKYLNQFTSRDMAFFDVSSRISSLIRSNFTGALVNSPWNLAHSAQEVNNILFDEMTTVGEMQMALALPAPQVIHDIIEEVLGQFHDGLITAQAAAEALQNQLAIVMMEME